MAIDAFAGKNKQIDLQRFELRDQRRADVAAIFALERAAGTGELNVFAFAQLLANRLAVGKDVQVDIRQLAGQIPAGGAGVEGNHHSFVNPGQGAAGDIRFMGIVAFEANMERIAAVLAFPMNDFDPTVVTQHFSPRL